MKELHIFSNGTEADWWNSRNCDKCIKATPITEFIPYEKLPCKLQHKLYDSRMLSKNFMSDTEWEELGFKIIDRGDYKAAEWQQDCTQKAGRDDDFV